MSDNIDIHFEGEGLSIIGNLPAIGRHLLRDAIDDIADKIQSQARIEAPEGETGELRAHPVDRDDTRVGVTTNIPLFGGGLAIRGDSGLFIGGAGFTPGEIVARSELSIPREPEHAVWVYQGTGVYGPFHTPIVPTTHKYMVFRIDNRLFFRTSVLGQRPNPYLERAFLYVEGSYIPFRLEKLRFELAAL